MLRWQHLHFTTASGVGTFQKLQLPAIPQIAHRIRRVHVDLHDGQAPNVGNIQWGFSHFVGAVDLPSALSTFLRNVQALWLGGSIQEGGNGEHREFSFTADEDVKVAGPQSVGLSNGSGTTIHVMFTVAYEDVRVTELEWTLLKSRTSFEED